MAVLMEILRSFKRIFPSRRPSAELEKTVRVVMACQAKDFTSQREIEKATGLTQPTVSRIVGDLIIANVLQVSDRNSTTASKTVELSPFGYGAVREFDEAMRSALKGYGKLFAQMPGWKEDL